MIPWFSVILAALALAFLAAGGVGPLLLGITALLMLGAGAALWWWMGEQAAEAAPSADDQRAARREAEATSLAAIAATAEAVGTPLLVVDRQRIVVANAPALEVLGGHVVGQDPRIALRHPDAVSLLEAPDAEPVSLTIRALTGSGSLWQVTRRPVGDALWAIELRDRTAEADMSRAHTDFVANASHELRTPLSSIIGYVETLLEAPAIEQATAKRFLGTVLREAKRMQSLVSDLMSLSQLEAEKHDLPTERIDLVAMAARVVGEFAPPPGEEGRVELAPITLERPGTPLQVAGDVRQIEQMLRNLIDNALKYGDDDKKVTVSLAEGPRAQAVIAVRDRGPGIAPDHLPHLTRRFYRTDPGRSRAGGGTGLGLAIVKHIVERHRGRLDIASTLGDGTTVTVRLPRAGL